MRRSALLWGSALLLAAIFGWADVRQRARLDRGLHYHRTDFTVYQAAAKALREGTDPYEARSPRGYRYVYPPLLSVLLMPVAAWAPENGALLFYAASAVALALAVRSLARIAGTRPTALACLACAAFLVQSFQRGQVTILLLALQVGALAWLLKGRGARAGLLLGLGAALRLTPLLPAVAALAGAVALRGGARLGAGVVAGLLLGFVLVPAAALGPARATEVNEAWIRTTAAVYGPRMQALDEDAINESRFKNQAPRRVLATYAGWATGAAFDHERPALAPRVQRAVDLLAFAIAAAVGIGAIVLGWRRLRDPAHASFAATFAAVILMPVLMTRYTWPTHEVTALPALAIAIAARRSVVAIAFAVAVALFYAAHLRALEPLGAAGPLLFGALVLLYGLVARPAAA